MHTRIPAAAVVLAALLRVVGGRIQYQVVLRNQRHFVAGDPTATDMQVTVGALGTRGHHRDVLTR
ncbi:hypothetical protein D3C79_876580 [compost metagenome]